jgi:hypothetical protein
MKIAIRLIEGEDPDINADTEESPRRAAREITLHLIPGRSRDATLPSTCWTRKAGSTSSVRGHGRP